MRFRMTVVLALVAFALIAPSSGSLAVSGDTANGGAKAVPAVPIPGTLLAPVAATVLVNGYEVRTGATIFPGSMLNTLDAGASVRLDPLGRLDIDPKTKVKLDFSAEHVGVELLSGCLILTANKGVAGEVHTPLGASTKTDPKEGGSIDVCADDKGQILYGAKSTAAGVLAPQIAGVPSLFSPFLFAVGAPVAAGVVIAADTAETDPRPQTASPATP
jgi:hypothetical protein